MEVKAHHIGAIIVATHLSKHHSIRGVFSLSEQTEKAQHVFFDRDKSRASVGPRISTENDPDVLLERAIIDLAGYEAEEIHHIVNHLPGHGRRMGDHRSILEDASQGIGDLGVSRADIVRMTLELVSRNWVAVRDLARLLMLSEDGTLDSHAATQRLNKVLRQQPTSAT